MKRIFVYCLAFCAMLFITACKNSVEKEITLNGNQDETLPETTTNENQDEMLPETATNGNQDETLRETQMDIVFLNDMPNMGMPDAVLMKNRFISRYDMNENKDVLYAFLVDYDHVKEWPSDYPIQEENEGEQVYELRLIQYKAEKAAELMKKEGLYVLSDYPYCHYNQEENAEEFYDNDRLKLGLCAVAGTIEDIRRVFDETDNLEGWYCFVHSAPRPDIQELMAKAGWKKGERSGIDWYDAYRETMRSVLGPENEISVRVTVE